MRLYGALSRRINVRENIEHGAAYFIGNNDSVFTNVKNSLVLAHEALRVVCLAL